MVDFWTSLSMRYSRSLRVLSLFWELLAIPIHHPPKTLALYAFALFMAALPVMAVRPALGVSAEYQPGQPMAMAPLLLAPPMEAMSSFLDWAAPVAASLRYMFIASLNSGVLTVGLLLSSTTQPPYERRIERKSTVMLSPLSPR